MLLAASAALADSSCDKPRNDFDDLYCLNKIYQQADHDLNTAFGRLRAKLDPAGQEALRAGQLAWINQRNDSCSKHDATGFYINLSCATQTTIARTQFLQDRYRECISSGCMNSRLK